MAHFDDFNKADIYIAINDYIKVFESEYKAVAVCGQIGGGRAMGLSNKVSDDDFDLYYLEADNPPFKEKSKITINKETVEVEFNYCKIDDLISAAKRQFEKKENGYPTCFYRDEAENKAYAPENIKVRWERDDYFFTKFHWIMMSDDVCVSNSFYDKYAECYKIERLIDAMNYYYIRAYGNYNNQILIKERINERRYLNTIWQILSLKWIVEKKTRPVVEFDVLADEVVGEEKLKGIIKKYLDEFKNTDVDKDDVICSTNEEINTFIKKELEVCREIINKTDRSIALNTLVDGSIDKYQRKIYRF